MPIAPKFGPASINPEVKSWIDNVIVPILVKEFLAFRRGCGDASNLNSTPVVKCSDVTALPEGVQ
jgi:hypothetical protein